MVRKLVTMTLLVAAYANAGYIDGYNVDGNPACVQVGDTCALDHATETPYYGDGYPIDRYAWVTEQTGDGWASVEGRSDLYLGESMGGYAEYDGMNTMYGHSGAGFAQFELAWNVEILNAWGNVQVAGPGVSQWFFPSNAPAIGSAWSDPIPMTFGKPFAYWLAVGGGLENDPGDCCGGLDLRVAVTGWRAVGAVPEPATLGLAGCALLLLGAVKRRGHEKRAD